MPGASTFTVTSFDDSGAGSLRWAIEQANAAGAATIAFALGSGPVTLRPTGPLPVITFSGMIDGRSQPGYAGRPVVEVSGEAVTPESQSAGLQIVGRGLTVRSIAAGKWPADGFYIPDGGENVLIGVYAGVALDGITNAGNGGSGIYLIGSPENRIGGTGAEDRIVSGWNALYGICLRTGAHRTQIWNSRVGTDPDARSAAPNESSGIVIFESADVTIGGADAAHRVIVSGNRRYGVEFAGAETERGSILGSYIGCDADGLRAIPNGRSGVLVFNAPDARIGGSGSERNVISGNSRAGINLDGSISHNPQVTYTGKGHARNAIVRGNYIGVDRTGEGALMNGLRGVLINFAQENEIVENVIAGNKQDGILVIGPADQSNAFLIPSGNRIVRNSIGTSRAGMPMGNGRHGVFVQHGSRNRIGTDDPADANIIMHNAGRGVTFRGAGFDTNSCGVNHNEDNGQGPFFQVQ